VGLRRAPVRFAAEAALLVAVGAALAAAEVELLPFVVVMAVAWVLIASAERMLSRAGAALPTFERRGPGRNGSPLAVPLVRTPAPGARAAEPEPAAVTPREPEPQQVLEVVSEPEPEAEPEPEEEEEPEELVPVLPQAAHRRPEGWNLWDLELRARQVAGEDQLRDEEWNALFVSLREFAQPDGTLPSEFDALVQESFGELVARQAHGAEAAP
jgi:hypothetical protein